MKTVQLLIALAALWVLGCEDKATGPTPVIGPVVVDTLPPSDSSQPAAGTFIGNFAPMRIGAVWKYSHFHNNLWISNIYGTYSLKLLDTLDGLVRYHYLDSMQTSSRSDSSIYFTYVDTIVQVKKEEKVMGKPSPFASSWYYPSEKVTVTTFQESLAYQFAGHWGYSMSSGGQDSSFRYIAGVGLVQCNYSKWALFYFFSQRDSLIEYQPNPL